MSQMEQDRNKAQALCGRKLDDGGRCERAPGHRGPCDAMVEIRRLSYDATKN